ncbi:dephospho-CoA kinase/protein folding accessory domain-containing protein [Gemmata sp. SH-PL17]|uniref:GrpB family protein n=1 Tax=Gemmata sp. SH-PL17 TaxID=1630693 RepID=UPI00078B1AB2|nr:GrpB family protein [Gemmata sp. SH-PL17]AMV27263.1 dephospho-CoA kinase/protein folding accessory domain-containing protein [Gemmata sp. SH-PL17]
MRSRYSFADYSPEWPAAFEDAAKQLRLLLDGELVAVHHIGSTSVPGLAAKPIIDLMPVVRVIESVDSLVPAFRDAGYRDWGEYGLPGRRYFTRDRDGLRTHNVHVYQFDNPEVERHLAFCAYLRHDDSARQEYEAQKRAAYVLHPVDIDAYNDAKNAWIKRTEQLALDWYRR